MMHIVHVQGGSTARGVPAGSQAASLSSGMGVGGATAAPSGSGPQGAPGMNVGPGLGGPGKVGMGMLPSGPGSAGPGIGGTAGNVGSGSTQAEAFNSWCLIDDGALGTSSGASTTPSAVTTPVGSTSAESAATPKKRAVLVEVERDIDALMPKLKNLWVSRQHAQVEGYVFDLGDFIVRAGNIMVASTTYKGILIEIEYLPQTTSATASNAILEEFVKLISPPGVTLYSPQMLDYPYEQVGLDPTNWSTLHSGFQYMTLFRRQYIL